MRDELSHILDADFEVLRIGEYAPLFSGDP
jgi:hypothetical protein